MTWQNPVPEGIVSRGFGPTPNDYDGGAYADLEQGIAHDFGNGHFPGSRWYPHFHAALDISAATGTPIHAPQGGEVLDAKWGVPGSWANGGGRFVRVLVNENCQWLVAHCSELLVKPGEFVRKGQVVAKVGSTGVSSGPHAHFWIRLGPRPYYDPAAFYFDPLLVLYGRLRNDPRFEPTQLPDTGTILRADGDHGMKFRSVDYRRTLQANKPIRKGVTVDSGTWRTFSSRKSLHIIGRIPKASLPESERQFGDVLITRVYVNNGYVFGYIKQADLAGN